MGAGGSKTLTECLFEHSGPLSPVLIYDPNTVKRVLGHPEAFPKVVDAHTCDISSKDVHDALPTNLSTMSDSDFCRHLRRYTLLDFGFSSKLSGSFTSEQPRPLLDYAPFTPGGPALPSQGSSSCSASRRLSSFRYRSSRMSDHEPPEAPRRSVGQRRSLLLDSPVNLCEHRTVLLEALEDVAEGSLLDLLRAVKSTGNKGVAGETISKWSRMQIGTVLLRWTIGTGRHEDVSMVVGVLNELSAARFRPGSTREQCLARLRQAIEEITARSEFALHSSSCVARRDSQVIRAPLAARCLLDQMRLTALSMSAIMDNLLGILLCWFDPLAASLAHAVVHLADLSSAEWATVDEELASAGMSVEVDPEDTNLLEVNCNARSLERLVVLRKVLLETLRLHPAQSTVVRRSAADQNIRENLRVVKDQDVVIDLKRLHTQEDVWGKDADVFCLSHFSDDRLVSLPDYAYLPFGRGRRSCVGTEFTFAILVFFLGAVTAHVHVRRVEGAPQANSANSGMYPSNPVRFEIRPPQAMTDIGHAVQLGDNFICPEADVSMCPLKAEPVSVDQWLFRRPTHPNQGTGGRTDGADGPVEANGAGSSNAAATLQHPARSRNTGDEECPSAGPGSPSLSASSSRRVLVGRDSDGSVRTSAEERTSPLLGSSQPFANFGSTFNAVLNSSFGGVLSRNPSDRDPDSPNIGRSPSFQEHELTMLGTRCDSNPGSPANRSAVQSGRVSRANSSLSTQSQSRLDHSDQVSGDLQGSGASLQVERDVSGKQKGEKTSPAWSESDISKNPSPLSENDWNVPRAQATASGVVGHVLLAEPSDLQLDSRYSQDDDGPSRLGADDHRERTHWNRSSLGSLSSATGLAADPSNNGGSGAIPLVVVDSSSTRGSIASSGSSGVASAVSGSGDPSICVDDSSRGLLTTGGKPFACSPVQAEPTVCAPKHSGLLVAPGWEKCAAEALQLSADGTREHPVASAPLDGRTLAASDDVHCRHVTNQALVSRNVEIFNDTMPSVGEKVPLRSPVRAILAPEGPSSERPLRYSPEPPLPPVCGMAVVTSSSIQCRGVASHLVELGKMLFPSVHSLPLSAVLHSVEQFVAADTEDMYTRHVLDPGLWEFMVLVVPSHQENAEFPTTQDEAVDAAHVEKLCSLLLSHGLSLNHHKMLRYAIVEVRRGAAGEEADSTPTWDIMPSDLLSSRIEKAFHSCGAARVGSHGRITAIDTEDVLRQVVHDWTQHAVCALLYEWRRARYLVPGVDPIVNSMSSEQLIKKILRVFSRRDTPLPTALTLPTPKFESLLQDFFSLSGDRKLDHGSDGTARVHPLANAVPNYFAQTRCVVCTVGCSPSVLAAAQHLVAESASVFDIVSCAGADAVLFELIRTGAVHTSTLSAETNSAFLQSPDAAPPPATCILFVVSSAASRTLLRAKQSTADLLLPTQTSFAFSAGHALAGGEQVVRLLCETVEGKPVPSHSQATPGTPDSRTMNCVDALSGATDPCTSPKPVQSCASTAATSVAKTDAKRMEDVVASGEQDALAGLFPDEMPRVLSAATFSVVCCDDDSMQVSLLGRFEDERIASLRSGLDVWDEALSSLGGRRVLPAMLLPAGKPVGSVFRNWQRDLWHATCTEETILPYLCARATGAPPEASPSVLRPFPAALLAGPNVGDEGHVEDGKLKGALLPQSGNRAEVLWGIASRAVARAVSHSLGPEGMLGNGAQRTHVKDTTRSPTNAPDDVTASPPPFGKLVVLYASELGTCAVVAQALANCARGWFSRATVKGADDFIHGLSGNNMSHWKPEQESVTCILVVCATYGGDAPSNARLFANQIRKLTSSPQAALLRGVSFGVLGVGSTAMLAWRNRHFLSFAHVVDSGLEALGATRLCDMGRVDMAVRPAEALLGWTTRLWEKMCCWRRHQGYSLRALQDRKLPSPVAALQTPREAGCLILYASFGGTALGRAMAVQASLPMPCTVMSLDDAVSILPPPPLAEDNSAEIAASDPSTAAAAVAIPATVDTSKGEPLSNSPQNPNVVDADTADAVEADKEAESPQKQNALRQYCGPLLGGARIVVVIAASCYGKPPPSALGFYDWLKATLIAEYPVSSSPRRKRTSPLKGIHVAVLGGGCRSFGPNFAAFAKFVDESFAKLGARRLLPFATADDRAPSPNSLYPSSASFGSWLHSLNRALSGATGRFWATPLAEMGFEKLVSSSSAIFTSPVTLDAYHLDHVDEEDDTEPADFSPHRDSNPGLVVEGIVLQTRDTSLKVEILPNSPDFQRESDVGILATDRPYPATAATTISVQMLTTDEFEAIPEGGLSTTPQAESGNPDPSPPSSYRYLRQIFSVRLRLQRVAQLVCDPASLVYDDHDLDELSRFPLPVLPGQHVHVTPQNSLRQVTRVLSWLCVDEDLTFRLSEDSSPGPNLRPGCITSVGQAFRCSVDLSAPLPPPLLRLLANGLPAGSRAHSSLLEAASFMPDIDASTTADLVSYLRTCSLEGVLEVFPQLQPPHWLTLLSALPPMRSRVFVVSAAVHTIAGYSQVTDVTLTVRRDVRLPNAKQWSHSEIGALLAREEASVCATYLATLANSDDVALSFDPLLPFSPPVSSPSTTFILIGLDEGMSRVLGFMNARALYHRQSSEVRGEGFAASTKSNPIRTIVYGGCSSIDCACPYGEQLENAVWEGEIMQFLRWWDREQERDEDWLYDENDERARPNLQAQMLQRGDLIWQALVTGEVWVFIAVGSSRRLRAVARHALVALYCSRLRVPVEQGNTYVSRLSQAGRLVFDVW